MKTTVSINENFVSFTVEIETRFGGVSLKTSCAMSSDPTAKLWASAIQDAMDCHVQNVKRRAFRQGIQHARRFRRQWTPPVGDFNPDPNGSVLSTEDL